MRKPDIEKYCLNCGEYLHRKRFNGRIEDYAVYERRKYCDQKCFLEKKHGTDPTPAHPRLDTKPAPEPPKPPRTKNKPDVAQIISETIEKHLSRIDVQPLSEAQSFPIIEPDQQLSAEEYLMKVMNDHTLPAVRRDNAAKLLITAKTKAPAKNKREERADAASSVATGNRFAPSPPPLRAVGGRG